MQAYQQVLNVARSQEADELTRNVVQSLVRNADQNQVPKGQESLDDLLALEKRLLRSLRLNERDEEGDLVSQSMLPQEKI